MLAHTTDIPLETEITKKIQRYLKSVPLWWGFKVQGGAQQKKGVPDIVGCYNGHFVALEVKRPQLGRLSALQDHIIEQIRSANGHAYVVRSVDDVKQIFSMFAAHVCAEGGEAVDDAR